MDENRIRCLIQKYKSSSLTPGEAAEWKEIWTNPQYQRVLEELLDEEWVQLDEETVQRLPPGKIRTMTHRIVLFPQKQKTKSRRSVWAVAAAVLLLAIGTWVYRPTDVAPGGYHARLTLPNGQAIELMPNEGGIVAGEGGITYIDGDKIANHADLGANKNQLLTLETPRGGQYRLILSDGSEVWLNAETKLVYPGHFSEDSARNVTLTGEAYFNIRHDTGRPFEVHSGAQTVRVLGTQFQVSAYQDEPSIQTTLLDGSVEVFTTQARTRLTPNQQAVLKPGGQELEVLTVEASDVLAWTQGEFSFAHEPLESIMRKLARWYDIQFSFADETLKHETYFGVLNRSDRLDGVLDKLQKIGPAQFDRSGNTIQIKQKKSPNK